MVYHKESMPEISLQAPQWKLDELQFQSSDRFNHRRLWKGSPWRENEGTSCLIAFYINFHKRLYLQTLMKAVSPYSFFCHGWFIIKSHKTQ